MSSETSAQWPVVAPGFMYIVKMGDYTHVLQPADQKSSEHLNLAQVAIRDINVARKLLDERGAFLLLDKQEKMNQLITETETAINRVIRILEPARIQPISDQSIRFNTRDPWALEDSPKSAATFGRLQITHNALKTVVHDLSNIEATVQLDDCNDRAEVTPTTANQAPPTSALQKTPSKGPNNLLTWKRSRRANRHTPNDSTCSGEPSKSDRNGNDLFSPISPEDKLTDISTGDPSRPQRDSVSEPDSSLQPDSAVDQESDVSFDRLPVIHELEGGSSIVQLGPVRPQNDVSDHAKDVGSDHGKAKALIGPETKNEDVVADTQPVQTPRTKHNRIGSTPPALRVTPPTLKQNNRVKRETFGELRQHHQEDKHPSEDALTNGVQPLPHFTQGESSRFVQGSGGNVDQAPGRFRSLKARLPMGSSDKSIKSMTKGVASGQEAHSQNGFPMSNPPVPPFAETKALPNETLHGSIQEGQRYRRDGEASVKSATYPPVRTQLQPPLKADDPSLGSSNQILSPSRAQLSPLEQIQPPDVPGSINARPLQPHQRDHQIFDIDPELTRLPSLLRAARPRQSGEPRPISRSPSRKPDELHISEDILSAPVHEPMDRSVTAPPSSHPGMQGPAQLPQSAPTREELAHLRSMSDTAVQQVSSTRGPIPPRKPLPYRNSPLPSREPSPHVVSRMATPLPERPQSELIQSPPNIPQSLKATSGPPSPIHSDHPRSLVPQIPRAPSTQSLQVQTSSTAESSRKSSISAEGVMNGGLSAPVRPAKTNGLAMNPPEIPDRGTSAYQAQKMAQAVYAEQSAPIPLQTPDYRSPAWQQTRHFFDPGHNLQLEQVPPSSMQPSSRFRDQDNQPRLVTINATRSKTIPEPGPNSHTMTTQAEQPRRASEQATSSFLAPQQPQMPLPTQQPQPQPPSQQQVPATDSQPPPKPAPSPKPSENPRSNFLQHQAAKLHARQQSNQALTLPLPPPVQLQQTLPFRVFLTPHHPQGPARQPQANRPTPAGGKTVPQTAHNAVTTSQNPAETQQMVKDKDLLATKMFRPSTEKRPTPPREPSEGIVPQVSQVAPSQQLQPGPQAQQQAQVKPPSQAQQSSAQQHPHPQQPNQLQRRPSHPIPVQTQPHPHECKCDDPAATHIVTEASKPTSTESLQDLIKMNNRLAQNVPSIPTGPMRNEERSAVPVQSQSNGQGQRQGEGQEQGPSAGQGQKQVDGVGQSQGHGRGTQNKRKKTSWLMHQAEKIAGKTGN